MADTNAGPLFAEPFRRRRGLDIRAGNDITFINKYIGNGAHAHTGNADKMNAFHLIQVNHVYPSLHRFAYLLFAASSSAIFAITCAASLRPMDKAAVAIFCKRRRSSFK